MSRVVTLQEIREAARARANQESTAPAFVDDAELNTVINSLYGRWYSKIVRAEPDRFEATDALVPGTDIDTTTGRASLPIDHMATLSLEEDDGNYKRELQRLEFRERNRYRQGRDTNNKAYGYRLIGREIELSPAPTDTSASYTHYYIPQASVLHTKNNVSTVDFANNELDLSTSDVYSTTGEGPVQIQTSNTLPTGLSLHLDYYIIVVNTGTIQLATSRANALAGTAVSFSDGGTGTHTIHSVVNGINGWEQWIWLNCALYILGKEESSTSGIEREIKKIEEEMEWAICSREMAVPHHVVDTRALSPEATAFNDPTFWYGR